MFELKELLNILKNKENTEKFITDISSFLWSHWVPHSLYSKSKMPFSRTVGRGSLLGLKKTKNIATRFSWKMGSVVCRVAPAPPWGYSNMVQNWDPTKLTDQTAHLLWCQWKSIQYCCLSVRTKQRWSDCDKLCQICVCQKKICSIVSEVEVRRHILFGGFSSHIINKRKMAVNAAWPEFCTTAELAVS